MFGRYRQVRKSLLYMAPTTFDLTSTVGKASVFALIAGISMTLGWFLLFFQWSIPQARADNVSTSLTVLNTPPFWVSDAQESTESSTSTPTNAGDIIRFVAIADDSSNDNYWLLICSASSTPVAHNNAPPSCGSGLQWAISATTTHNTQASAATTTKETFPFATESNNWFGYICDGNTTGAQCNPIMKNGSGTTVSPFVINHPPVFKTISNDGPKDPGAIITWTASAYDNDTIRVADTVKLYVCKAADFATSTGCGAGGTWAASTFVVSNPATSTTLAIPLQDKSYSAFVYIEDQSFLVATSTFEASHSDFSVNNVTPSVDPTTISLVNRGGVVGDLTLNRPAGTSSTFTVQFIVSDNNSCQNSSSGNEIASATTTIYRSGIGASACQTSGNYDTNSCYPSANTQTQIVCSQDTSGATTGNACSGSSDSTVGWVCSFPLWFNADPTDAGSVHAAENWLAGTQVTDDNGLLSPFSTSTTGNDLDSFLAIAVTKTSINYSGLQPGQQNDPLATTTDLQEQGNTGVAESLYGDTMCTTWTAVDSCDTGGADATRKIPVSNQEFASSSVAFASTNAHSLTASTSPRQLALNVPKTTSTSSIQTKNTWWGINVPGSITVAGSYSGQNTILGIVASTTVW
jgi:hypothetical protein